MSNGVDTSAIYNGLKDFQKTTVDFVYDKLQINGKFLVADEVGLGKTMIAKGIIAKTYDGRKNKNKKLQIVYIATNQSIASQNIETLKIGNATTKTERLSLLVTKLNKKNESNISFNSFTVGTSLEFKGNSTGIKEEREFLIYLLRQTENIKGLWSTTVENFFKQTAKDIDTHRTFDDIPGKFIKKFEFLVEKSYPNLKEVISNNTDNAKIIRELRKILVLANLEYLNPDLIILDEFQRFSKLLTDEHYADREIIKALFNHKDSKILLLSATPYKLLDCSDNTHYNEFYDLILWLYKNRENEVEKLKDMFSKVDDNKKDEIEKILKEVMCRTERTSFSKDGMIEEKNIESIKIKSEFLNEYKKYNDLEIKGLTRYLKSSPSPLNFMKTDTYKAKREFDSLDNDKSIFKINNKHPKLELLKEEVQNQSLENHIWMPPLSPYVKTRGIAHQNSSSKILIFSQWDFTPDSIVGSFSKNESERYRNYTDIKAFSKRDKLLEITTNSTNPYKYEGTISFSQLVKQTKDKYSLTEIDAKLLLGSPANVIYRSILKYGGIDNLEGLQFYIEPEEDNKDEDFKSFSHLFLHYLGNKDNRAIVGLKRGEGSQKRLEKILDYCIKHNIQAMFDEYIHLLTDSPRYQNITDCSDKILYLLNNFRTIFMLRPNEITIDNMEEKKNKLTSKFAMRISKSSMTARTDKEAPLTADNVKTAFNSPFAPFILATTSIGQEGLDFHPYCHQIWHWDLPSNPVDLEQREGRIHRYKNYAVRKNVAKTFDDKCWIKKFEKAKVEKKCDFQTYWLFSTDTANQKIERVIPCLPFSKDEEKYKQLIKQVSLYRRAIGKKRQSDCMSDNNNQICLSPN